MTRIPHGRLNEKSDERISLYRRDFAAGSKEKKTVSQKAPGQIQDFGFKGTFDPDGPRKKLFLNGAFPEEFKMSLKNPVNFYSDRFFFRIIGMKPILAVFPLKSGVCPDNVELWRENFSVF